MGDLSHIEGPQLHCEIASSQCCRRGFADLKAIAWKKTPDFSGANLWSCRELNPGPSSPCQGFSVRSPHRISARPSGSGEHVRMMGPVTSKSPDWS